MTRLAAAIRPQPVVSGTATRSLRMTSLRPETDQFAVLLTRELSTRKRVVLLTSARIHRGVELLILVLRFWSRRVGDRWWPGGHRPTWLWVCPGGAGGAWDGLLGGGSGCFRWSIGCVVHGHEPGFVSRVRGQVQGVGASGVGHAGWDVDQSAADGRGAGPGEFPGGGDAGGAGQVVGHHRAGQPAGVGGELPGREVCQCRVFRSAMTCSMIAWSRWWASAVSIGSALLVNTAWWR